MFAPFPQDSEMIGPPEHTWMINFRVDDLDAMVDQLRAAGETVEVDPQTYPNGCFAELRDPEGNGIQLWQPMDPERSAQRAVDPDVVAAQRERAAGGEHAVEDGVRHLRLALARHRHGGEARDEVAVGLRDLARRADPA